MTFDEAMENTAITAVRKTKWAAPWDRLELPRVLPDGTRGAWCTLIGHDGVDPQSSTPLLTLQCRDLDNDWQEWVRPEGEPPAREPEPIP